MRIKNEGEVMKIKKIIRKGIAGECVYEHDGKIAVYKFNSGISDANLKKALEKICGTEKKKADNKQDKPTKPAKNAAKPAKNAEKPKNNGKKTEEKPVNGQSDKN